MASPYDYPTAADEKPPKFTIMTVIAVAFALFMVYQVGATITESQDLAGGLRIEEGDRIEYHYVARLPDGTLWDTTRLEVAQAANQTEGFPMEPAFSYEPKKATIDPDRPGLGWGAEAESEVIGSRVGKTVTFTVPGENATGEWEPLTPGQPGIAREVMSQPFQRTVFFQEPAAAEQEGNEGTRGFDLDQLDEQIGPIHEGFVFNAGRTFPPSWDVEFIDVNRDNRSVTFRHTVQDGQYFDVPQFPGGMTALIDEEAQELSFRLDLEEGSTFTVAPQTELAQAGFSPGSYRVASVTEEYVELLYHSGSRPDAVGQPITVTLTILDKTEGTGSSGGGGTPPPQNPSSGGTADDGHAGHNH